MEEDLTEKDVSSGKHEISVSGPSFTSELRLNPSYLEARLGPWASDKPFQVTPQRVIIDGDQATLSKLQIGPEAVFTWGDASQVRFQERPMWIRAVQEEYGAPITLDISDGDPSGQTLTVAKEWLWERGILGLKASHSDGYAIEVVETEGAFDVHVDHFSEIVLGPSDIVLGQVGSGPITQHLGEVRWDAENLTLKITVDNYVVTYTVYLQKSWADTNMPDPLVNNHTWTTQTVNGDLYYKVVLPSERTPTIVIVESSVNRWWLALGSGGNLAFTADAVTINFNMSISSSFVAVNGSLMPSFVNESLPIETEVLRSTNSTANATAVVVLGKDFVAAVVNYRGSHRMSIPEVLQSTSLNSTYVGFEAGESVRTQKYIVNPSNPGQYVDPTNVYFYDQGNRVGNVLTGSGWETTSIGGNKMLWVVDGIHGGSSSNIHTDKHYQDGEGMWGGFGARYHLRTFPSATGDTHSPGFNKYVATPVHWEACEFHSCVDPQAGQDYLLVQMSESSSVGNWWMEQVTFSPLDCSNCEHWDGWIDVYQVAGTSDDPCGVVVIEADTVANNQIHLTCEDPESFAAISFVPGVVL